MQHRNRLAGAWWAMQNPEVDGDVIRLRADAVGDFKEEERFCDNCNANVACSLYARMSGGLPEASTRSAVATKVLGKELLEEHKCPSYFVLCASSLLDEHIH